METVLNRSIVVIAAVLLSFTALACNKTAEEGTEAKGEQKVVVSEGAESESQPGATEKTATADESPVSAECKVDLAVDGMVCSHGCSPKVMKALEGVDGVAKVNVSFEKKHAEVLGDGDVCSEPGAQKLIDALKGEKFEGKVEKIEPYQG